MSDVVYSFTENLTSARNVVTEIRSYDVVQINSDSLGWTDYATIRDRSDAMHAVSMVLNPLAGKSTYRIVRGGRNTVVLS